MKKFSKILLIIFLLFVSVTVSAEVQTKDRNDLPNYGVNKKWVIDSSNKSNVLKTPSVDASEKVYDFSDIIDDNDEQRLKTEIEEFIDETSMDMVIVTIDEPYYTEAQMEEYAADFYDYNDFGLNFDTYSGVLILRNSSSLNRYYNIYTFGEGQLYFSYERLESTLDLIYNDIYNDRYLSGFTSFVDDMKYYFDSGIPSVMQNYYIDDMGYLKSKDLYQETLEENEERKELKNYGVNKKWVIDSSNKTNVLTTPLVDASEKIYDFSNVIDDSDEEVLKAKIKQFVDKTHMDMVIVTIDKPYYSESRMENYAADFYDYNDFGLNFDKYSGVLILRNSSSQNRYYNIYTFGEAQLYFSYDRLDQTLDMIYNDIYNDRYLSGFTTFIDDMQNYFDSGIPTSMNKYYVDDMGYLQEKYVPPMLLALGISGFVTAITMYFLISQNKMVKKAKAANEYLEKETINITQRADNFITSRTTSRTINTSSGGGGGSSSRSSSRGSSGGGHSSGGGRRG